MKYKMREGGGGEMTRHELIEALRSTAELKGVTHREIAEGVGMKRPSVSRILTGKYPPNIDNLIKLATYLGMKVEVRIA